LAQRETTKEEGEPVKELVVEGWKGVTVRAGESRTRVLAPAPFAHTLTATKRSNDDHPRWEEERKKKTSPTMNKGREEKKYLVDILSPWQPSATVWKKRDVAGREKQRGNIPEAA